MNKLDLSARVLTQSLGVAAEQEPVIKEALRDFTVDCLNVARHLTEKNVDPEMTREIMDQHGISYDGKSKRFK